MSTAMNLKKLLLVVLLLCGVGSSAESPQGQIAKDRIYIKFVDSNHNTIPYFIENIVYIADETEQLKQDLLVKTNINFVIFPYQQFGLDIWPEKRGFRNRPIIDNTDIIFKIDRESTYRSIMDGYPQHKDLKPFYQIIFIDGSTFWISREELKSQKEMMREIEIPGQLGSGVYGDAGRTLAKAAYYWYFRKGSASKLIKECNQQVANLKSNNLHDLSAGFIFIREYWLWDHIKPPLFSGVPGGPNELEAKQLPWEGRKPRYGRFGSNTPILASRAFKYVLNEYPSNTWARFFVEILPTVAGFDGPNVGGELSSQLYVEACFKIYMANKDKINDSQKVEFLKIFINTLDGLVYIERYWNHRKDSMHGDDLIWYTAEVNELQSRYGFMKRDPFLHPEAVLNYLKDPSLIVPKQPNQSFNRTLPLPVTSTTSTRRFGSAG